MPSPSGGPFPGIKGLYGRAYLDLEPYVDTSAFGAIHDEVCLALANLPADYTGGSHRSMGIMPPSRADEALVDYMEAIRGLSPADFEVFRALSDDPRAIDAARRDALEFGEERAIPLSRRQMLWLKVRHGVYFPWKAYVELIPNRWWGDKATGEGKSFTRVARTFFPRTIAFVESLPFVEIGRCNVMGLEAFDYGTVHRDGDPAEQGEPDHFITFVPGGGKRLFLWDETLAAELYVDARVYWFNDFDYHGVAPATRFRYSIRVDGRFDPAFLARLEAEIGRAA